jgi:hypothetical protein
MARTIILAAFVGSALTFGVVGLMSMTQVLPAGQHVIVSYGPHPSDMITVREGTPLVVPPGKLFVLTGLGSSAANAPEVTLVINGQPEAQVLPGTTTYDTSSIKSVPIGFTAPAGSTIELVGGLGGQNDARAWGYLADQ